MLGIVAGAFVCDSAAAHWRGIAIKDIAFLIGFHAVIIGLGVLFARRRLLGLSAHMWTFAIALCYAVGFVGVIWALRPGLFFGVAGLL